MDQPTPKLAHNVTRLGHLDLPGAGQVLVEGNHAYIGHITNKEGLGTSILDIADPKNPKVVAQIPVGDPASHAHKARAVGDLMITNVEQNMTALADIFRLAQRRSTRVIAYIPPLRQDVKPPYDPQQYLAFKAQTLALCQRYGVQWVDFDKLVPGQYWGTKAATRTGGKAELDFMHYQEPGHLRLAQAMQPLVEAGLK